MRILNLLKKITLATFAVTLLATSTVSEAKTVAEPKQTRKETKTVGESAYIYDAVNLKINGKKYSKSKKKVKTVAFETRKRVFRSYKGTYKEYIDSNVVYDTETTEKQKVNYNYIDTTDYRLDFLKPGTYKVSFDKYSTSPSTNTSNKADYVWCDDLDCYATRTVSNDLTYYTYTPVLFKTTYTQTYKVLQTEGALKSISLGKSSVTTTVTRSGAKYKSKTVTKNRYLKGTSGKVKYKANSNYQVTSGYAITRNADGYLTIAPANNNNTVAFSKASYSKIYEYDKVVVENGVDKKDADGNKVRETKTTGNTKDKYKFTDIVYGYKNKFIGNYTSYAVSDRVVYIPTRPEKGYGEVEYQKDAAGNYVKDANGNNIPLVTAVTAKVLTTTTTRYGLFNGKYQLYAMVSERVISPKAIYSISDSGDYAGGSYPDYWVDQTGTEKADFGDSTTISIGGIPYYVTYADGSKEVNPAYRRANCSINYVGTWVDAKSVTDQDKYETFSSDYSDKDNTGKITTEYVYKYTLDANGNRIYIDKTAELVLDSTSSSRSFKAK